MTPIDTVLAFKRFYNERKYDKVLELVYDPVFPAGFVKRNCFGLKNFVVNGEIRQGEVALVGFKAIADKLPNEGYFLLIYKGKWLIATIGKNKQWLLELGKRCLINFESNKKRLAQYAKANFYDLSTSGHLDHIFEGMSSLPSVVLVGVGEHHSQTSYDLSFRIVCSLIKRGYQYLVLEKPIGSTWFYQKYLESGNSEYYRWIADEGKFFRGLQKLNDDLPPKERITVKGVDINHIEHPIFWQVKNILQSFDQELEEQVFPQYILPVQSQPNQDKIELIRKARKKVMEYKGKLIHKDKKGFKRLSSLLQSQEETLKIKLSSDNKRREKFLKDNFIKVYEDLRKKGQVKIVGLFGNWHVAKQSPFWEVNYDTLGRYLYKELPEDLFVIKMLPYAGKSYKGIQSDEVRRITIPKGSLEDLLVNGFQLKDKSIYLDLRKLGSAFEYYTRGGYFLSSKSHDAVLLYRSSLPDRSTISPPM